MRVLWNKFKEVGIAIVPIFALVLIFNFTIVKMESDLFWRFIIGLVMVVVGEVLFLVGVETSIITMGETVGASIGRLKKIGLVLGCGFLFGFLCTIAEPDVQVLGFQAKTYAKVPNILLVMVIGLGVGVYVALSMLRNFTKLKLKHILFISYVLIFGLAVIVNFVNPNFLAISFDSGGVTTGPITVPFILALGIGAAAIKGNAKSDDSFGVVALASAGPIIAMLILGLIFKASPVENLGQYGGYGEGTVLDVLKMTLGEVAIGLIPITVIFLVFQFFLIKLPKKKVIKILIGTLIDFVGLTLFLGGVNFGFSAAAYEVGRSIAESSYWWLLIPAGLWIGFATVYTEPAVLVLGGQVEEVTDGKVTKKTLVNSLAVAIAIAIMLAVFKVLFEISIWWFIVPGYSIALGLMFFCPDIFTGIAFDSGGVASGPMTATFSLPLMMGISKAMDSEPMLFAFGSVALVAMMPLIVLQVIGVLYKRKAAMLARKDAEELAREMSLHPEAFAPEDDIDLSGLDD